jgi:hypothetical protein
MTRRTLTRRFTNGDYIDSYASTPLMKIDDWRYNIIMAWR